MIHCPKCNRIIMDTTSNGGYKVRSRMILFNSDGVAEAICPSCKKKVEVPLQMKMEPPATPKQKLIIKENS